MSITQVATNNTPPTVVAKPYRRTTDTNDDDNLPQVAVKERKAVLTQVPDPNTPPPINAGDGEDTWKKRYGDLRRHSQNVEKELKQNIKDLSEQVQRLSVAQKMENLPKTKEEVEAWAEQYKDSYDIIRTVATTELQDQLQALQSQIDSLKEVNEETSQQKAAAVLSTLVPGWEKFNDDAEFHTWLKDPKRKTFAEVVYNGTDPYEIAEVLETYMARTGKKPGTANLAPKEPVIPKPNINAALNVPTPNNVDLGNNTDKQYIRESEVAKLSAKDFEKYEEAIDAAQREGRFIYDLSGKAQ